MVLTVRTKLENQPSQLWQREGPPAAAARICPREHGMSLQPARPRSSWEVGAGGHGGRGSRGT